MSTQSQKKSNQTSAAIQENMPPAQVKHRDITSMTASNADDGEGINRDELLVVLFIVVVFVVAVCLFMFTSVCEILWYVLVVYWLCDPTFPRFRFVRFVALLTSGHPVHYTIILLFGQHVVSELHQGDGRADNCIEGPKKCRCSTKNQDKRWCCCRSRCSCHSEGN